MELSLEDFREQRKLEVFVQMSVKSLQADLVMSLGQIKAEDHSTLQGRVMPELIGKTLSFKI